MTIAERQPSAAVIVLNWNGTEDTLECLASLQRITYPRAEIIVVDNGSRPSPRSAIQTQFPHVRYFENSRNLGYSGGNNVGIRYAVQCGHDYVFILNNDTVVEPDVLTEAIAVAETDTRIAAVGAKALMWENPARVWTAYGQVTYRQNLVHLIGLYELNDGRFDEQRDVPWVPGTALLLRRSAIEQLGPFDEAFFAYHEDVDWCTAAWEHGWRVVFAPRARLLHKGHRSSGGKVFVTPRQYLAGRNMMLFARKHARWYQWIWFAGCLITTLPLQYLKRCWSGEQQGVVLKMRGMLDGLRGRPLPLVELGLRPEEP